MDIALISPSGVMYRNKGGIFPKALRYAPLTLTTLAGLIPKDLEAKVQIVDEGVSELDLDLKADLVGISAITGTSKRSYAIADHFRNKGSTVVLGGVHPTLVPDEAQKHADTVVTGLAFDTWPQLLKDFNNGEIKERYSQPSNQDLSDLPIPRRDLLGKFSYISKASTQATFGCPYKCDFCAVVASQPKYLHRPISEVVDELEQMKGNFVVFVDPSPTEDRDYIKELWTAMVPLKKKWGGLATVRLADDDELMDLAAESGCKGLLLGFESVSQEAVRGINKGFNKVDDYKEVVKKLHDRGISINGTFMFGMDSDTKDSFKRTVDFVNEVKIDLPRYAVYTPFPGTPVFNRLDKEKRILTKNWTLYDGQHVVYQPKNMSPDELREGQLWAWEQTYSPRSIFHRSFGGGGSPLLSLVTNFGYGFYGRRLRNFPSEEVERIEGEWNPKINIGETSNVYNSPILKVIEGERDGNYVLPLLDEK
jgi:radical SAM superfamily enzyme YgiQ (UPF0313 family)